MFLPEIKSIFFFVFAALSPLSFAANVVPVCPGELHVEQTISEQPEGWNAYGTNKMHRFVNVMFSNDNPAQSFILLPSKEFTKNKENSATWNFSPSDKAYWISCLYSETKATVARELPKNIQTCSVTYDGRFTLPVVKEVNCH
ncbi:STY0301 family protein [Undibacterium sp. Xuan67W]